MAGFDNDVMYADNVDFTGSFPVGGQINLDGELLVGSSVAPNIRSYVPTGSGGVNVVTGQGTLDLSLSNIPNTSLQNSTITVTAGSGVTVAGSPVALGGNVTISASGGSFTVDQYEVVVGDVGNTLTSVGPGSAGQVLQSGGAAANPVYSTATFPATAAGTGTILRADGTNWVASTPTYPNAASTAGKVVVSDGTNLIMSTPTFPNASATSGKVIKSDGTNWVASTETYAAPSTSGNVMTSDGTNWTSAVFPSGTAQGLTFTTATTLTSAQIKALHGTPIQIIAAPGAGKVNVIIRATARFTYGGTNVFVAGAGQIIDLYFGTVIKAVGIGVANFLTNAQIVAAASSNSSVISGDFVNVSDANFQNLAVNAYNLSATEISGNAGNNNTIHITVLYYILTM